MSGLQILIFIVVIIIVIILFIWCRVNICPYPPPNKKKFPSKVLRLFLSSKNKGSMSLSNGFLTSGEAVAKRFETIEYQCGYNLKDSRKNIIDVTRRMYELAKKLERVLNKVAGNEYRVSHLKKETPPRLESIQICEQDISKCEKFIETTLTRLDDAIDLVIKYFSNPNDDRHDEAIMRDVDIIFETLLSDPVDVS
ncbi:MAG: hypothetical protein FWB80_02815 [Defluviitaleaceae bacterium]|nr:hypothetical protein [Defluviitaleaceae bacterium]